MLWPFAITLAVTLARLAVSAFLLVEYGIGATSLGMIVGGAGSVLGGALAFHAWPALGRRMLGYALAARPLVLAITALAIWGSWGTHLEKLGEGAPEVSDAARFGILAAAQVLFWFPITLMGGITTGLAWLLAEGRRH